MYLIRLSKQAAKDRKLLAGAGLERKAKELLDVIGQNPFTTPPPYEKLSGDLKDFYSRRINLQHRLVYMVNDNSDGLCDSNGTPYKGIITVARMWTHYE